MRALSGLVAALLVTLGSTLPTRAMEFHPVDGTGGLATQQASWNVQVNGEVASVVMEMHFVASDARAHTGELRFPLPPGAVLRKAEVWIPSEARWETAETMGRREGEQVYSDAIQVPEVKEPLLVQQVGWNAYRALVYPVSAGDPLRLRIHYAHLLEGLGASRTLRIALNNHDVQATDAEDVVVDVRLVDGGWSQAVWKAESYVADEALADAAAGTARLTVVDATLKDDILLELTPDPALPEASALVYTSSHPSVEPHVLARWAPNLEPFAAAEHREPVFVLDISGSMAGRKFEEEKEAVIRALHDLDGADLFGIVAFSDGALAHDGHGGTPPPPSGCSDAPPGPGPTPTNGRMLRAEEREQGITFVNGLSADGGTNMSAGLELGVEVGASHPGERPVDLVLVTDGNPSVGPTSASEILQRVKAAAARHDRTVRIFALGIGHDLDQSFINMLARETGGEATFALSDGEIAGQFLSLFGRVRNSGLASVTVELVDSTSPPLGIAHLLPGAVLLLGGRGSVAQTLEVKLSGTTMDGQPVQLGATVTSPPTGSEGVHLAIPALAAKAHADELERRADSQGETPELLRDAVILAKTYGIVTRYSSLLALDDPTLYARYGVDRIARDAAGVATEAVTASEVDESRIGGEGGTHFVGGGSYANSGYGGGSGSGGGCWCAPPARTPWHGVLAALVIGWILAGPRRRSSGR
ncbi:MAG: VWA domain-containing protein [Myxococcota bacterium]